MKPIRFNPDYARIGLDFFLQLVHASRSPSWTTCTLLSPEPAEHHAQAHLRNFRAEIVAAALERWGHRDQLGREISTARSTNCWRKAGSGMATSSCMPAGFERPRGPSGARSTMTPGAGPPTATC